MSFVIFALLATGVVLVAFGLNPFLETLQRRGEYRAHADPRLAREQHLAPERTGTVTFPTGLGFMAMALALSALWGGAAGLNAFGGMLQFASLFFFGRWLWLRFGVSLGDRLNRKILNDRLNRTDDHDPYALSYHHQMRFVSGFFTLLGFGATLFVLGLMLQMVG